MTERTYKVAFGTESRRPGCVLLQAGFGGDSHIVSEVFDTRHWLLAPSEPFAMVTGTKEQFRSHAAKLDKAYPVA